MPRRAGAVLRAKRYNRFRGVDFSTDPALVDDTHSPWAPNMVSDVGGMPEKRPGWRTLQQFEGRVNGVFSAEFNDTRHFLAHAGTTLYRWYPDDTEPDTLAENLPDARSIAVYMGGRLWIFTGRKLLCYDGETCAPASDSAYVPLTVISADPSGGGTAHEAVNLLTGKQRVGFLADGTSTVYHLPCMEIESVDKVEVNGAELSSGYTADLTAGTVTFSSAPSAPDAGAEDNVFITFTKTTTGNAARIDGCTTAIVWGASGSSDRIVAAGNAAYPNLDFTCGYDNGFYWPDIGYAVVGTAETAILGYCRLGEYLAVVKEDNGQDSSIFLRSGVVDADGKTQFFVKPCLSGTGAITRFGFGHIGDEQLILTGGGVCALTTNSLTAERIVQNRSARVDPKLLREDLREAVTCSYRDAYLIFAGGHVYGLDGRQPKSYPNRNDTAFLYECFYWENVPARCVAHVSDNGTETLYFGTADGRVCRFNTDVADESRYNDDGAAIEAVWATKSDDDGDSTAIKELLARGNAVTLKPYARSSTKILLRTDRDPVAWQTAEGTMDIFDWTDIDFSRLTFNANDAPQEIAFPRGAAKRYRRLQILIKNDAVNEGFGIYGVVKHFAYGAFAKGGE